jgi:hypothetical protein
MEKVPVATTDTDSITGKRTCLFVVNQGVSGRGMPDTMENGTKIPLIEKKQTENQRKKVQTSSCP